MRCLSAILTLVVCATTVSAQAVSLSATGGVTFAASNPNAQPVTPGSNSIVATVTLQNPKNNKDWTLTIESAGPEFQGATGSPVSVSGVDWTATGEILDGKHNSIAVNSGQTLGTNPVVVAYGAQGTKSPAIFQIVFDFTVENSWNYDADTYFQNLILVVTAE